MKFLKSLLVSSLLLIIILTMPVHAETYGYDTSSNQMSTVNPIIGKELGYDFIYLRIGSGYNLDKTFLLDYAKAKDAGLKIGIYYAMSSKVEDPFSRDTSIKNAQRVLDWIKQYKIELDLPIVYDMECSGMWANEYRMRNAIIYNAFTGVCNYAGYNTMYYCSASRWRHRTLQEMIYDPIWIAAYGKNDGTLWGTPSGIGRDIDMFQYSSGINQSEKDWFPYKLDRDVMYTTYEKINALPETITMYTTREVSIWLAPIKTDEYRLKMVANNYLIQVYPTPIQSGKDTFYRTIKGCYVLSKYLTN